MKKIKIANKVYANFYILNNMDKIVIYCHGIGETKESIKKHVDILNENNIGVVSFDFPSHGEEKINYQEFNCINSLKHLDTVYNYIKENYHIPICLMGSSYGGYIALCYINYYHKKFDKVFLKYPAVNFYENLENKMNFNEEYFNNHDYFLHELTGYKLYRNCFLDYKKHDIRMNFDKCDNDIFIIHGSQDNTVYLSDVLKFCDQYNINLYIVDGDHHGLRNNLDLVNHELIKFIR